MAPRTLHICQLPNTQGLWLFLWIPQLWTWSLWPHPFWILRLVQRRWVSERVQWTILNLSLCKGDVKRSQHFSKGGHSVPKRGFSPDFHVVLPPVVGCLLKTWITKGGHGQPRTPPPLATPLQETLWRWSVYISGCCFVCSSFCFSSVCCGLSWSGKK